MEARRSTSNNAVIRNLRLRASEMVRSLQKDLDKAWLDNVNKLHMQFQKMLEHEERKSQSGPGTALSLERARLEKKISMRNEKEALRLTEYEEKEEDLKDKLDLEHDKIIESEKGKNNALLDTIVKDSSLELQIKAKKAEIDATIELKASSCWSVFFCCGVVPAEIKQKRNELQKLEQQLLENRSALAAADAGKKIATEESKREKVIGELKELADSRVVAYDSDSDKDEEKLADVKYLIEQAKKNQTHLLAYDTMITCLRFYELALYIFDHQPLDPLLIDDMPLLSSTVKQTLEHYIGGDQGALIRLLKEFYCQDADGLTTTFTEMHEMFEELAKGLADEDRITLINDEALQGKLLGDAKSIVSASPRT